jgi:beta-1,2-mannobiose phosphorylase / 1,2-beta-oligomannan phosphorylase
MSQLAAPTAGLFIREPANPIVTPGGPAWRRAVTFNPAVWHDGKQFWMLERCASSLRPFICQLGLLRSDDGVRWELASPEPVFTPAMCGSPIGSVQDPRVTRVDDRWWLTFAYRPYAWSSHPTGVGVPESHETEFPNLPPAPTAGAKGSGNVAAGRADNLTRSGLAVSDDCVTWTFHSWITPADTDDRNVILFPEKIGGRYAVLRRPLEATRSCIWISYSDDLQSWTAPELLARAELPWESNRIGGSCPPIRTEAGWLVFYHGVETTDPAVRAVTYRMGAMLLALDEPTRILARSAGPLFEPEAYYEKTGLYIPNVVFPTACVVRGDELLLYYGACDTCIGLARGSLRDVLTTLSCTSQARADQRGIWKHRPLVDQGTFTTR